MRVGLRREHLAHRGARRRHRERVAEEGAARRDGGLLVVAAARTLEGLGDLRGHAVGAQRHAARDRFPDRDQVGREAPGPREPAGAHDLRVGLVVGEQGPGLARDRAEPVVEAVDGELEADLVREGGLRDHDRDLARLEGRPHGVEVVEGHDHGPGGGVSREARLLGHELTVDELDQGLVEMPVVLPVEEEHLLAAGRDARDADRLGVRVRRRQGELPLRQAVAAAELLGDPDRVLVRQQELRAGGDAARDRLDHGRGRVPGEHRHVGDVEVGVVVPVDVAEPAAEALVDEDRRVVVRRAEP